MRDPEAACGETLKLTLSTRPAGAHVGETGSIPAQEWMA